MDPHFVGTLVAHPEFLPVVHVADAAGVLKDGASKKGSIGKEQTGEFTLW